MLILSLVGRISQSLIGKFGSFYSFNQGGKLESLKPKMKSNDICDVSR